MKGLRIVLGDRTLRYLKGGGHWAVRLQYLLGLRDIGCDVSLLEVWPSSGSPSKDAHHVDRFLARLREYGLHRKATVLVFDEEPDTHDLASATCYGRTKEELVRLIDDADILWNLTASIKRPLLDRFSRKTLIDLDPGVLHVSALTVDMHISSYDAFLTVGTNIHDVDSTVPTLGVEWTVFLPFVYLPLWTVAGDRGPEAPISSVTHWNWREISHEDQVLSLSKRKAYLQYVSLPVRSGRPFELAVHIPERDPHGDRALLKENGWTLVDPHEVAKTRSAYQGYIAHSRAEISCPKPIFKDLRTGWVSDRSACYLASGRPVLAEDTGFSNHLPVGDGLLSFTDVSEAAAGVEEIDSNYDHHMRSARAMAEEFFDSRKCLKGMLDASV